MSFGGWNRNAQLTLKLKNQSAIPGFAMAEPDQVPSTATFLHDCRNILGCMRSTTRGMLTGQVGPITETQQKSLDSILEDLANLVSSMDRYEQVEELDRLRTQRVDLGRLCWQALDDRGPFAAVKQ